MDQDFLNSDREDEPTFSFSWVDAVLIGAMALCFLGVLLKII